MADALFCVTIIFRSGLNGVSNDEDEITEKDSRSGSIELVPVLHCLRYLGGGDTVCARGE